MTHGTVNGYNNHKCRCVECRAAWSVYDKAGRARRRAAGLCRDCLAPASGIHSRCENHLARLRARYHERKARVTA